MKKSVIALMLSIVMAVGSVGGSSVFAAETTAQGAGEIVQEEVGELEEVPEESEETDEGVSAENTSEEESAQVLREPVEEDEEPIADELNGDEQDVTENETAITDTVDVEADENDYSIEISDSTSETEEDFVVEEEIVTSEENEDVQAGDLVASGTCGENVTWTLDGKGTLTVSGTGRINSYNTTKEPWYSYLKQITAIVVQNGITAIGGFAFWDCLYVTRVTIPDGLTSIGKGAFYNCQCLESITIPDSVTYISDSAFGYCKSLTSVEIPSGVTSIYHSTFQGCTGLTSVLIPSGVTSIEERAFEGCTGLTSVTIPENITSIETLAFGGCTSLKNVTIPNSVTSIGQAAFSRCTSFTNVTIPNSVTSIGPGAYSGCTGLTSVTIPNSVTSIGNEAFYGCSSLTSVTIPEGVTSIYSKTFYNCSSLTSVTIPNSVTGIGSDAFNNCSSLTSVTIPESMTSIGYAAFQNCTGLTSITIPSSVKSIDTYAFSGCTGLTSVTIPNSVVSIGSDAFSGCSSLKHVSIPNGVTSIERYTFSGCTSLESADIPNSVKDIGSHAFSGCVCLDSSKFELPESVTKIDGGSFYGCSNLEDIRIPDSVTSIGGFAFYMCSKLKRVTISASVTSIGSDAFKNCPDLIVYTANEYVISYCKTYKYRCNYAREFYPEIGAKDVDYTHPIRIVFDKWVTGNNGYAYLYEVGKGEPVDMILLSEDYVRTYSKDSPRNNLQLVFNNVVSGIECIESGKNYYIEIEENAIKLSDNNPDGIGDETSVTEVYPFPGIYLQRWEFNTIDLEYASFTNPNINEISKDLFRKVFKAPIITNHMYNKKDYRNPGGICYGMAYVSGAKKNNFGLASQFRKLYSYTYNDTGRINGDFTISDYMKMAYIYQKKDDEIQEVINTTNKFSDIVNAIRLNKQIIIHIWKKGLTKDVRKGQHSLLPIRIVEESDSEIKVQVYDCNGVCKSYEDSRFAQKSFLNTLTFKKKDGNISGIEYCDDTKEYSGKYDCVAMTTLDDQFEQLITSNTSLSNYEEYYEGHPLLRIRQDYDIALFPIQYASEYVNYLIPIIISHGDETEETEEYLYWVNGSSFEGTLTEDNTISITDGYDEIEVTASSGASIRLDVESNTAKIENADASAPNYTITHTHAEDYDNTQSIVINGVTSSTVNTECTDNGIIVSIEDNTPVEVIISVTENGDEVASADITATTDSVNVVYDDDDGLTVLEDKDSDGTYETIINTSGEKTIENAEITGISNKQYTGSPVVQSFTVKSDGVQLKEGTDYTVDYSNNTKPGTATVTITGIGTYTGTIKKTFKITPKLVTPTITLSETSFVYNGKEQKPGITVKDGKTVLSASDYTVTWPSGCTDVGTYRVRIDLKGNYSGSGTADYKITEKKVTLGKTTRGDMFNLASNVKVTWKEVPGAKYYKVYREGITDKKETREEPVIVTERLIGWDKEPGLTNGHAYRYKIVASLTGKGDSSGDSKLSYSKLMYRLKTVVIRSVKNTAPGKVTVKYDKTTSGDSYVLQYCERQDMVGAKTKVVLGANNTSYVIGGLKKGKTYYISIRVRKKVDGIDYYTTFGVPKKITITK